MHETDSAGNRGYIVSVYKLPFLFLAVILAKPEVGALSSGIHCFQEVLDPRVKPEDDDFLLYTQTLYSPG